jgi:hypothetical protein
MTLEEIEKSGRERLRAEIEFVRKISERCTDVEVLGMILVLRQAMISMANNPTESK